VFCQSKNQKDYTAPLADVSAVRDMAAKYLQRKLRRRP
jgi:hypothetical protein